MSKSTTLIQPYLFFGGRCEEALEFYRQTLNAEVLMLMRFKDSPEPHPGLAPSSEEKVMHATIQIGETKVMASDGGMCEGREVFKGFSLSISTSNEAEAERMFSALADGGKVDMPLSKTFWAPKFGMLTDQFGVSWMVSLTE